MYTSKLNIKHNRSAEIHWGVHKLTNEIVWIDDVERNGYACNCKCACCGSELKACTQGKIQQHHFKHRGNNGCYYSDEIAEYLKAKEILSSFTSIWIPPIAVRIGDRPQIIQTATQCSISNLYCSYDSNHYPPLLIADIDATPTRIILSFSGYYNPKDYKELIEDARENSWDCLEIIIPQKNDGLVVTKELIYEYTSGINTSKRWIWLHERSRRTCAIQVINFDRVKELLNNGSASCDAFFYDFFRKNEFHFLLEFKNTERGGKQELLRLLNRDDQDGIYRKIKDSVENIRHNLLFDGIQEADDIIQNTHFFVVYNGKNNAATSAKPVVPLRKEAL